MANVKITDLVAATTIAPTTDQIPIVAASITKKVTPSVLVNSVLNSSAIKLIGTVTAVGTNLLQVNSDALINGVTVGKGSGTGGLNTAIGKTALSVLTTGVGNTAVGNNSGNAITSGSNNVVIGSYTGAAAPISATGSNFIVLSDGAGIVRQTIDASGHAIFAATVRTSGYTIATLPAGVVGMRAYVTNGQATPTYLLAVTATGTVTAPVFYNGTAWVYG